MEDCIFCKIVRRQIPKKPEDIVYEDESVMAFFDIQPKAPGHTILIPKEHHRWFQDMPDNVSDPLFRAAKTLATKLKGDYRADFVHLSVVGTDVPHVHIHLIPRKLEEGNKE